MKVPKRIRLYYTLPEMKDLGMREILTLIENYIKAIKAKPHGRVKKQSPSQDFT